MPESPLLFSNLEPTDEIEHVSILKKWKEIGIPQPEDILHHYFCLDINSSSSISDIVALFDRILMENASDGAIAALITYKNDLTALQAVLSDKDLEIENLTSQLDLYQQKSSEMAFEYENRLEKIKEDFQKRQIELESFHSKELEKLKAQDYKSEHDQQISIKRLENERSEITKKIEKMTVEKMELLNTLESTKATAPLSYQQFIEVKSSSNC